MPTATKCAVPWSPVARRSRPWRRTSRPESGSGSGLRRTGNPSAPLRRDSSVQPKPFFEALHLIFSSYVRFVILVRQCYRTRVDSTGSTSMAYATFPLPANGGRTHLQGSCRIFTYLIFPTNTRLRHTPTFCFWFLWLSFVAA